MSHEIDMTTGVAAIAYAGQAPWHKLGQKLTPDAPLEVWQREAGLAWEARRAPVQFAPVLEGVGAVALSNEASRDVLYRSDTGAPLGIVAAGYKIVQPSDVMEFFRDLTTELGFKMEVAGAIKQGRRIWALARVNKEAVVRGDDLIRPYVLLSTSFDGSTGTTAQFTTVRVVCNNTLTAADNERAARVSVWHSTDWRHDEVKSQLGLVPASFDAMMQRINMLADRSVSSQAVDRFLVGLLAKPEPVAQAEAVADPADAVRKSRAYKRLMDLFEGGQIGADLRSTKGTAWGLVSAVTEYVDHHAGLSDDTRMNSAWFGKGAALKTRAFEQAVALVA